MVADFERAHEGTAEVDFVSISFCSVTSHFNTKTEWLKTTAIYLAHDSVGSSLSCTLQCPLFMQSVSQFKPASADVAPLCYIFLPSSRGKFKIVLIAAGMNSKKEESNVTHLNCIRDVFKTNNILVAFTNIYQFGFVNSLITGIIPDSAGETTCGVKDQARVG